MVKMDNEIIAEKTNILVVDDEPGIVSLLKEKFESKKETVNVVTASSGDEAIKRIKKGSLETILCDIKMGEKGGIHVLKYMRDHNLNIPVVLMTADPEGEIDREAAIRLGAFNYILKDFSKFEIFLNAFESALKHYRGIRKDESRKQPLDPEEHAGFIKFVNETYLPKRENDNLAKRGGEREFIEYVVNDKGLRHLYTSLSQIIVRFEKPDGSFDEPRPFFRKSYLSDKDHKFLDISERRRKRDDRWEYEVLHMKFLQGRQARVVDLVYSDDKGNLFMENLSGSTDDVEMMYFNSKITELRENNHEDDDLEHKIGILSKQKQKSMIMSDETIDINSELGTFFMSDVRDVGGEWAGIVRPTNSKTGEYDPFSYHEDRIRNSIIGLALWQYFDDKIETEKISKGDILMSRKIDIIQSEKDLINSFDFDKDTWSEFRRALSPIFNCYKSDEFVGYCHADLVNTEHLVRHMIKFREEDGSEPYREAKIQYDLDGVIWDKWMLDNLSYLYDHIGNDNFESIDLRFENSVVRRHNKRAELLAKTKDYEGYLPKTDYKVDFSKTIESLDELPKEYVGDLMKQKDMLTVEVLLFYSSLGAWNQLKNTGGYYTLLERTNTHEMSFDDEEFKETFSEEDKKFKFIYSRAYNNWRITGIQSKKLKAFLDKMIKNESKYYTLKPKEVKALTSLKELLTKGVEVNGAYQPILR